jgi:hypothetical protein
MTAREALERIAEFHEIHTRLGYMHGYGTISDPCRANRHEECEDGACQCACHAGEDE